MLMHYLAKQEIQNCAFSLKHGMLLCQRTHNKHLFKLQLGRCWITLHSQCDRLCASDKST